MAEAILLDSDVLFDAAEWIGVGKIYKDVPIEVSDACCDARKIPADLQATLPSTAMPVTEFLALLLPGILDGLYRILDVPGFDGESDNEDEEEEEYEEPEAKTGGKKTEAKAATRCREKKEN
ncbi:hypothetical protein B0H14DRAFT_3489783 [Mycena olivaceomarginata]|nr:hypothetical protein B0H14DRAFT_3489783 [Mycena olivaceomarginata]